MAQISAFDLATFRADGVLHLKGILSNDDVEKLRSGVSAQMADASTSNTAYDFEEIARSVWEEGKTAGGTASRLNLSRLADTIKQDSTARPLLDQGPGGKFFYEVAGWRRYKSIRDVALDSVLPEVCFQLFEGGYVNFWEDTTFVKAPGTRQRTAFHQDLTYSQSEGTQCAIAWIPLDHADIESGVLQYVRGSHLWGETFAPNVFVSQTPIRGSEHRRVPDIESDPEAFDLIHFDVAPGDVVIHDIRTLHGAGGNPSNRYRRAISFRYCGENMRYHDRLGAVPEVNKTHSLKNGDRLFTRDYPVVFPKPWPGAKLSDWYDVSGPDHAV